jgi:hypothetical protein
MIRVCLSCGCRGDVHLHHVTGRPFPNAAYFDPGLTSPMCRGCHGLEHVSLRRLSLGWLDGSDPLAHRLFRVAGFAARLADGGRGLALSPGSTRAMADLLLAAATALRAYREGAT